MNLSGTLASWVKPDCGLPSLTCPITEGDFVESGPGGALWRKEGRERARRWLARVAGLLAAA